MPQKNDPKNPTVEFNSEMMSTLIRSFTPKRLASFIDVTDLKTDTSEAKVMEMVEWARVWEFPAICVRPMESTEILPRLLRGSAVKECYVIDFPLGQLDLKAKADLTARTVEKSRELRGEGTGKIELDMVINVDRFRADPDFTRAEIEAVCQAADGEHVKVIVRSPELTQEEIYRVSEIVADSKAHFIKNSTGLDAYGAVPEHIRLMREVVGSTKGVKAAGGIADTMIAMRMIYAGALDRSLQTSDLFRIGSSRPLEVISPQWDGWKK